MTDVLPTEKPKGRSRGRVRPKATDSLLPPGLLVVEHDSQSCGSYDELSRSDIEADISGSQRSSFSDSAPSNLPEKDSTLDVPKSDELFLDAEIEKISFGSMEMTSSPLVTGRKSQVDSPLAVKLDSPTPSAGSGHSINLNIPTGITPLAGNLSPLPDDLNASFHEDDQVAEPDLDEKEIIFVRVTQCVDPSNFSAQIGRDKDFEVFSELEAAIERYCQDDDVVRHEEEFGPQYYVLARQRKTNTWKRAFVMGVDRDADEVDVFYIDYGVSEILQFADIIFPVPDDFLQFQQFNYVCSLDAVKPLASVWISRAVTLFKELVFEKKLEVEVVPTQPLNVTIYIDDERRSVADLLLEEEVAVPCVSPSLMLQSPEPTESEGVTIASTLVTPEQYPPGIDYPDVGSSPSVTLLDSSIDDDTPEENTSSQSKPSKEYLPSVVESISKPKTPDVKSDARSLADPRKSKSEASTNVSRPNRPRVMKTTENPPNPVVRVKSEHRHVKSPNKGPPAFQFDQLFKASAKITKPIKLPLSPDTTEAEDLWKSDPDILFMFGKEVLEERKMSSLGLIKEQTDDEVQQNANIVEKIRQGREDIRKSSQQAASQRTRSPTSHSPVSSKATSGQTQRDGSPLVASPHRSRRCMKKNLDKAIKAFDGKQEGKVQLADPDGGGDNTIEKIENKKSSNEEKRDQAIVEFLCCLHHTVETSDRKVRELAFENTSKFMDDCGLNLDVSSILSTTDLEQYLRSLLRQGVIDTKDEFIIDLFNLLQKHDSFGTTFSFTMPSVMLEFVRVGSPRKTKHEKSDDLCEFLIKIIKASTKWTMRSRTGVLDFTQKTLEKWLIYNKKGSDLDKKLLTHNTADLERLFLQCTITVLTAVGHVIDDAYPEKVVWMMTELRERQLDHDQWNMNTRSNVLDLLLLQARGWDRAAKSTEGNDISARSDTSSGCSVGVQCNLLGDESKERLREHENGDAGRKSDSGTAETDSEVAGRLKEEPAEYTLVKAMLYDLHLDHLYTNFVSWGITDSLIKSEEMHLGNYLVSCGFTIPLVSKMMEYLDRDMPVPPVAEERVETQRSLGEPLKDRGLPSGRMMMDNRSDRDRTPEQCPEKKETIARRSEVTPTKTLDFGSKEESPSSLKDVAEGLFKTDKEIRKQRATGMRNVQLGEYNMSEYFRMSNSKAGSGANVVLDDKKEFPPLADTEEAEALDDWDDDPPLKQFSFSDVLRKNAVRDVIAKKEFPPLADTEEAEALDDWDDDTPLKQFSFSDVLRKKAVREVIAKFSDPPEMVDSVPEAPTINDWFEERRKGGASVNKLGKAASSNSAVVEPSQKERTYAESVKISEAKSQDSEKVSEKIAEMADDWFYGESEDEEEDEDPMPKRTFSESQPRAQPEQSARPRPSDSWKMKRYSQTSPILKDPCNNVIAREDSLGLNAISDLLESEACGDASEPVTMATTQKEIAKSDADSSQKPSWWRIPSPPKENDMIIPETPVSKVDVQHSAHNTKTAQDKNNGNINSVKKTNERSLKDNKKVDSKKSASDSKKMDGPESVVDWMLTGSSALKGRTGLGREKTTPVRASPGLKAAEVETRSSTPDCWSDLSDSDVADPPVMFEPKLDQDACEKNRPKIDKLASMSLIGDWLKGEESEDFGGGNGAKPKKDKSSGKCDIVDGGQKAGTSGTDADKRAHDEAKDDAESLSGKYNSQVGLEKTSDLCAQEAQSSKKESVKNSHDSFKYDFQYVPQLEDVEISGAADNATYDGDSEEEMDLSERKFAIKDDDVLSDSDSEVVVIMDEVIDDRILEEKEQKRKLHEKYVRLPETDQNVEGFCLAEPKC